MPDPAEGSSQSSVFTGMRSHLFCANDVGELSLKIFVISEHHSVPVDEMFVDSRLFCQPSKSFCSVAPSVVPGLSYVSEHIS